MIRLFNPKSFDGVQLGEQGVLYTIFNPPWWHLRRRIRFYFLRTRHPELCATVFIGGGRFFAERSKLKLANVPSPETPISQ